MNKKEPLRMCIACKEMKNKRDLLRIVKDKDGKIFVDLTGKSNGRGAYVCKDLECLQKLKKQKALNKAFKCLVPDEVFGQIEGEIIGKD